MHSVPSLLKCPICDCYLAGKNPEPHILDHVDTAQAYEMNWYQRGKEARAHYRELFHKEI